MPLDLEPIKTRGVSRLTALRHATHDIEEDVSALIERVEELEAVLRFYADQSNWSKSPAHWEAAERDRGERARAALSKKEAERHG